MKMMKLAFSIFTFMTLSLPVQAISLADVTDNAQNQAVQSPSTVINLNDFEFLPNEYVYLDFKLPYREVRINFNQENSSNDQTAMLVILLHSKHCSGRGNTAYKCAEGVSDILEYLTNTGEKAVFLIPQVPDGREWNESYPYQKFYMSDLLKNMIENFAAEGDIDPNRIYLLGASMGGSGVWRMVNDYPELFTSVLTTAAKPKKVKPERLALVPILAVEGTMDKWSKPSPVEKLFKKVNQKGGITKLEVLQDRTHRQTCQQAFSQENLKWVFSKKKQTK